MVTTIASSEDVDEALTAYQEYPSFSAGEGAAYSLGLWGSGQRGGSSDSNLLLDNIDEDSMTLLGFG